MEFREKFYLNKIFLQIIAAGIFLFVNGCVTPTPPACIPQGGEEIKIRWGTYLPKSEERFGYELRTNAELFSFSEKNGNENFSRINRVTNDEYCGFQARTKENFLKIQTLNAPGDTSRFVEYSNPKSSTYLRAVWNAKYETYGSREFRELYDSLSALVSQYE